jgi:hypothetical protein
VFALPLAAKERSGGSEARKVRSVGWG